jgi:hypothetical protein
MSRATCRYCFAPVPEERKGLRGRRSEYCSDDHQERDRKHERNAIQGRWRWLRR